GIRRPSGASRRTGWGSGRFKATEWSRLRGQLPREGGRTGRRRALARMPKKWTPEQGRTVLRRLVRGQDRGTIATTGGVTPGPVSTTAAPVKKGTYALPEPGGRTWAACWFVSLAVPSSPLLSVYSVLFPFYSRSIPFYSPVPGEVSHHRAPAPWAE